MNIETQEILGKCFPVLDDGFVMLVDVMGSDESIEQAARISYGEGTRPVNKTRGLLRYLMRHKHTTPFEMVELKFMIRIPMDAWRQMIRHRTANVNEYSTRYSEAIDRQQKTPSDKWRLQSSDNKQGSSGFLTDGEELSKLENEFHSKANELYNQRLESGIAREQARKDLPLSTYTEAYWKCDLHNIFHFLKLRCDSHAQLEIRSYANVIAGMVQRVAPLAFEAWIDYSFCSSNFTRLDKILLNTLISTYSNEIIYLRDACEAETPNLHKTLGMSDRELEEFWEKIQIPTVDSFSLDLSKAKDLSHWRS